MSDLGTCALCYIGNCFGVVGLCNSGFYWEGTSYLCIVLYQKLLCLVGLCRSGFNSLGGTSDLGRYACCYIQIYLQCALHLKR